MHRREDDMPAWADDPVVRALTAPGTPGELGGEAEALAAFRAAVPVRTHRRFVGRFGTGASTFVVAVALSGGVAAAYTHALPAPLQRAAHGLLGPVGVPGPSRHGLLAADASHHRQHHQGGHPVSPASTTTSPRPSSAPQSPARRPAATPSRGGAAMPRASATGPGNAGRPAATAPASPVASPSPSPTPSPTPKPQPTRRAAPVPASLSAVAGRGQLPAGQSTALTGHLVTASGAAVPRHLVRLLERPAGSTSWSRVAARRTGPKGYVVIRTPALARNTRLMLAAGRGVHSAPLAVVVVPVVSTSVTRSGRAEAVAVHTTGGDPGDSLVLQRRRNGRWVKVAATTLGSAGDGSFRVKPARATVYYRVVLARTTAHAPATASFAVKP